MIDYREHAFKYLDIFSKVKLIVSDNDGVLTDGKIYLDDNVPGVAFNVLDGFGIRCIQEAQIEFAILSGRSSKALVNRVTMLKIKHAYLGYTNKLIKLKEIIEELEVSREEVLYIGDDIIDLPCYEIVGVKTAVANAHPILKDQADYVTLNTGGNGAVREIIDLILISQGKQEFFTSWL